MRGSGEHLSFESVFSFDDSSKVRFCENFFRPNFESLAPALRVAIYLSRPTVNSHCCVSSIKQIA